MRSYWRLDRCCYHKDFGEEQMLRLPTFLIAVLLAALIELLILQVFSSKRFFICKTL